MTRREGLDSARGSSRGAPRCEYELANPLLDPVVAAVLPDSEWSPESDLIDASSSRGPSWPAKPKLPGCCATCDMCW